MKAKPSEWARWQWPNGLGRWHAIVDVTEGVTRLACGRTRKPPKVTAPRPGNDKCCPECRTLDDLRLRFMERTEQDVADVVAVPVGASASAAN